MLCTCGHLFVYFVLFSATELLCGGGPTPIVSMTASSSYNDKHVPDGSCLGVLYLNPFRGEKNADLVACAYYYIVEAAVESGTSMWHKIPDFHLPVCYVLIATTPWSLCVTTGGWRPANLGRCHISADLGANHMLLSVTTAGCLVSFDLHCKQFRIILEP